MPHFRFFLTILTLSLALALGWSPGAWALAGSWQKDDSMAVRLISGVDAVGQNDTVPLGIDVELQPGWHTYWRSPGAAGLPPQIDWHNESGDGKAMSRNLQAIDLFYPAPKRYAAYGLDTIGYRGHVVFPVTAHLTKPGQPLVIDAALSLLVCSDTCVPKNIELKLTIPAGIAKPGAEAALIQQFRDQLPVLSTANQSAGSALTIRDIRNDGHHLVFTVTQPDPAATPDLFIENDRDIAFTAPEVTDIDGAKELSVGPADRLPEGATLAGMHLTVTLTSGDHSVEQHVVVPPSSAPIEPPRPLPASATTPLPLGLAILFALIGGFILNLMPCVLPVLSLKLLNIIGHGGKHTRLVRASFLATAAGILFSFLALAGITILLKLFGVSVGWGVQFQQPLFLTVLILVVTFFAANMWGFFDINLPRFIADIAGSNAHHPKLLGDFVTGAFATLLATPCTAPFLGTAVGFALASGPRDILIIFTALGFGMILPYLAIALFPKAAAALPKPGLWMVRLRSALGGILALTVGWLLWVLAAQLSVATAAQVGLCMTAIILLLALQQKTAMMRYGKIGVAVLALVAFGFVIASAPASKTDNLPDSLWTPFDEAIIAADIAEGKTVFVDVTADWCLTCKANKKFVLSQSDIADRLFRSDIVAMQADWTNPDPAIAAFLKKYRRYGIPFNIVYGPGAPSGIVLPELLSKKLVIDALDKAHGTP